MMSNKLLLFLLLFLVGCSSKKISFQKKKINDVSVLINAKNSTVLAFPIRIKTVAGGFLIYDHKTHKICRFQSDGNLELCFGHKGRGPGEYLNVNGMWKFNHEYLVYDRLDQKLISYSLKGQHIKDIPIKFTKSPIISFGFDMISPTQLITVSSKKKGMLMKWVNFKTDSIRYFGKRRKFLMS